MWLSGSGRQWRPFKKIAMAGVTTIGVSALGVAVLLPGNVPLTMDVLETAAIDESNTTLGFADSDLYGMTPAQIDAQLDQMQAMGVNNVRIMIPWAGVEFYPNYYNWSTVDYMVNAADSRGMGVLGVINSTPYWATQPGQPALSGAPASPQAYGDFAGLVAQRYAGKVGAYEVWNEPNAAMFYAPQPDPAGYTALLKAAYPEIKAADPNATVIGGVTGAVITYGNLTMNPVDFVNGIYAAGGEPYFDALSFHPYQFTTPFSQGGYHPDSPINQLAAMRNVMVANGDATKLIWASEYGEPSNVGGDLQQAAYLQDMITKWRTLGYTGPTFVWSLQDRNTGSTDPEDNFGVIRTDGTWKQAAYVIQQLAAQPGPSGAMARMALAAPESTSLASPELAALAQDMAVASTPQTPMAAAVDVAATTLNSAVAVASSVATLNPLAVAATSLAAVNQVAATTMAQVNAVMTGAPVSPSPSRTSIGGTSPTAIPMTTLDQLRSVDLARVPSTSDRSTSARAPRKAADSAATPRAQSSDPAQPAASPSAEARQATQQADTPKRSDANSDRRGAGPEQPRHRLDR